MIAAGVGVALLSGGVGAGIGLALRSSPSTVISTPGGGSSSSNGGTMSAAAIAAAVDPSLVDINDVIGGTRAAGTGIIVTPSGEVLTNNHVIDGATDITAQIDGQGTIYQVKVLGYDNAADVALLQIEGAPTLQAAPLGNSSSAQVGSSIVVLGNALGQGGTPAEVTGTVTALDQTVTASDGDTSETLNGTIQIQANIEPGDSGGAVVDSAGKIIAMTTAGSTTSGPGVAPQSAQTTGFAIPINTAVAIANQIRSGSSSGSVVVGSSGPLIGVEVENTGGSAFSPGAVIVGVQSGSPAATAGLQAGDVIVSINGAPISTVGDLSSALRSERPGQTIQVGWTDAAGGQHTSSDHARGRPPN